MGIRAPNYLLGEARSRCLTPWGIKPYAFDSARRGVNYRVFEPNLPQVLADQSRDAIVFIAFDHHASAVHAIPPARQPAAPGFQHRVLRMVQRQTVNTACLPAGVPVPEQPSELGGPFSNSFLGWSRGSSKPWPLQKGGEGGAHDLPCGSRARTTDSACRD